MRVLVTGSGGMLGSRIVSTLAKDKKLIVFAATSHYANDKQMGFSELQASSISNSLAVELLALNKIDLLINCAFPRDNKGSSLVKGLEFTSSLFASVKNNCSVINISSQSVYSQTKYEPAVESDVICPQTSYGIAKYTTELMLERFCKCSQYTNIRLASLLAPGFDARFVNKMIEIGCLSGNIQISGPNNIFGFMSVKDAAEAVCKMALTAKSTEWHPIYNLGPTEKGISLKCIGDEICTQIVRKGYPCTIKNCITGQYETNSSLDSNLFYQDFNWHPKQDISCIISEIIDYCVSRGNK